MGSAHSVDVVEKIPGLAGQTVHNPVGSQILLSRAEVKSSPLWFKWTLIHEFGHADDFDYSYFGVPPFRSDFGPWGKGPYISEYAETSRREDYADTHVYFHLMPKAAQRETPEKFARMAKYEEKSFLDKAVDRKEFRETGKWIGEALAHPAAVRTAAQTIYWAASGFQILRGLEELRSAKASQDPQKHLEGALDVAAGTLFASKVLAVFGLALEGTRLALIRAIARGEIRAEEADSLVRLHSDKPLSLSSRVKAVSIATGGAVGGAAGGILGPYLGIIGGYSLGGPVGGALGLIAGAITGYELGSSLGGRGGPILARALKIC